MSARHKRTEPQGTEQGWLSTVRAEMDLALERYTERYNWLLEREKELMVRIEEKIPVRVKWRRVRCGKRRCRCARGALHGPYAYTIHEKDGERRERYEGRRWRWPEGGVAASEYRRLLSEMAEIRREREHMERSFDRAISVLLGVD